MNNITTALLCEQDNSALVIVDLQTHLTAVMPAKVLARLQRNIGLLINAARILNLPVFASEQYPQGLGNIEPDISKLLPDSTKLIEKTSFSCTGEDNFLAGLRATGCNQVVLAGMEAHVCILQTALQLLQDDYQVFVVADAVCSRHRESYETALERMKHAGVIICDAESVLFEWMRDAKHEKFKEIQTLIR